MNKKTIRMFCHGPAALGPEYRSPWEDVWLQYKVRRRVVKEGPCFMGLAALYSDIWIEREMLKKTGEMSKRKGCADWQEHHEKRLNEYLEIKRHLETEPFYCDNWERSVNNIYIAGKSEIGRRDIEEATAWYLRKKGVLKSEPRFRWNKPDFIACPVSFEPPTEG